MPEEHVQKKLTRGKLHRSKDRCRKISCGTRSSFDSRTCLALQDANVYGAIPVNNIDKRLGTALCNLVSKKKSSGTESLGGKGKLTSEFITQLEELLRLGLEISLR